MTTAQTPAKQTFYITFRLRRDPANVADYDKRLTALTEAIRLNAVEIWWKDPTSYIAFWSAKTIDELAAAIKTTINVKTDVVLLAMTQFQDGRLIGYSAEEANLLKLMPFVKKA